MPSLGFALSRFWGICLLYITFYNILSMIVDFTDWFVIVIRHGSTSMKLVIAGATGFIGSILMDRLWNQFHDLTLLSRRPPAEVNVTKKQWFAWQPGFGGEWEKAVDAARV